MLQSVVLGIDWFVPSLLCRPWSEFALQARFVPCQLGLSFPVIGKSSYDSSW